MPELLAHLRRVRNRLGRNTRDLDWALALAELEPLPPGQIRIIQRALATNKRLFTSIRRIQARVAHKHKQQP